MWATERHRIPKSRPFAKPLRYLAPFSFEYGGLSSEGCPTYNFRRMKFNLVDQILSQSDDTIVTIKQVTQAEEYLGDHFPSFPILPGVLMLEAMVQAASRLCADEGQRLVLGEVKALKFGAMVKPGDRLQCKVNIVKENADGSFACKGTGTVLKNDTEETQTAVAGRFTIRPVRMS
jgi:3-hydroxymyristoyl/3-hydroxydecanoyl-(acyl carrier protein) dehydratase